MKNFFCPYKIWFEPICFSSSLAVWDALGFAFHGVYPVARRRRWFGTRPPNPSPDCEAIADEDRIPFELFLEYTASWENTNLKRLSFLSCKIPIGGEGGIVRQAHYFISFRHQQTHNFCLILLTTLYFPILMLSFLQLPNPLTVFPDFLLQFLFRTFLYKPT